MKVHESSLHSEITIFLKRDGHSHGEMGKRQVAVLHTKALGGLSIGCAVPLTCKVVSFFPALMLLSA